MFVKRLCKNLSRQLIRNISTFKESKYPTFVFLEGDPIISEQHKVFSRLGNMGFKIYDYNVHSLISSSGQILPVIKYVNNLVNAMEEEVNLVQSGGEQRRDNVVFFGSTLLSPLVYQEYTQHKKWLQQAMKEVLDMYKCRLFLCETDEVEMKCRIAYHVEYDQGDKITFEKLPHLQKVYKELYEEGWFEKELLHTSDSIQACCVLLERLNIEFRLPSFPNFREKLSKITNSSDP